MLNNFGFADPSLGHQNEQEYTSLAKVLSYNVNSMTNLNDSSSHAIILGQESDQFLKKQSSELGFAATGTRNQFFQKRMSGSRNQKYLTNVEQPQLSSEGVYAINNNDYLSSNLGQYHPHGAILAAPKAGMTMLDSRG